NEYISRVLYWFIDTANSRGRFLNFESRFQASYWMDLIPFVFPILRSVWLRSDAWLECLVQLSDPPTLNDAK
ncbi:MAG: hypothetical protein ACK517_03260, partial [bacterium]